MCDCVTNEAEAEALPLLGNLPDEGFDEGFDDLVFDVREHFFDDLFGAAQTPQDQESLLRLGVRIGFVEPFEVFCKMGSGMTPAFWESIGAAHLQAFQIKKMAGYLEAMS